MSYPTPGGVFGGLSIERELGRGGFGRVFLAFDALIGRRVALKVVEGPAEASERILREARLVGQLVHPNIVTLHRVHAPEGGGAWCFEFEFVEGGTLQDLLAVGRLDPVGVDRIATGIAAGLAAAHVGGVLHGDVKPRNILIARDGTPKLADFGLGRLLGDIGLHVSDADAAAGTPAYMAPEVLMGEPASLAADVWSLGVVLYAMACGRLPFAAADLHSLLQSVQEREPLPPPPETQAGLVAAIHACLEKRPDDRPRDAAVVAQILRAASSVAQSRPARPEPTLLQGRDRELAQLRRLVDAALAEGKGGCVLITGEPGVGKSALMDEVVRGRRRQDLIWITARVTALEGIVRPLLRGLRTATAAATTEVMESTRETIRRALEDSDGLRIDSAQPALATLERAIAQMLGVARLGIVIEDLEQGNADDTRVATHLMNRLVSEGVVLILLARSGTPHVSELSSHALVEVMALEPLAREDSYALLEAHAGRPVDARIARLIHDKAAGNPRHLLELYRHLLERGGIRLDEGRVTEGSNWESSDVPPRFRDLVAQRLDRLPPEDRELLEVAAVAGVQFDGTEVAGVLGRPVLDVLRRLQRIYRERGLVVPLDAGYRFSSPMVQEVVYGEIAPDLRRLLHGTFATRLPAEADPERLAVHWAASGDLERAAPYYLLAARRAARRTEIRRAIELAAKGGIRAAALEPSVAREHCDLLLAIGGFHVELGNRPEAERVAEQLHRAATDAGDEVLRLRTLVRRLEWRYRWEGQGSVDLDALDQAARRLPPTNEKVFADYLRGLVLKFRGDLEAAATALSRAMRTLDDFPNDGLHASVLDQLAAIAMRRGRLEEAQALYRDAARVAARGGRRRDAAASEVNCALVGFQRGAIEGLGAELERAIRSLDLEASRNLAAHARLILSMVQYAAGDLSDAERTAARAVGVLRQSGYWLGLGDGVVLEGMFRAARGRYEEALTLLREGEEIGRRDGFLQALCSALGWQVKCHWLLGQHDAARAKARECVDLARTTSDLTVRRQVAGLLAEAMLTGMDDVPGLPDLVDGSGETVAGALVSAALARPPSGAHALRAAAERLRAPDVGERRAEMRIQADVLEARAARWSGDRSGARHASERAREAAKRLGLASLDTSIVRETS